VTVYPHFCGAQGALVVEKLLMQDDPQFGYDARNDVYGNMMDAGIIDPRKVTRTALQDAAGPSTILNCSSHTHSGTCRPVLHGPSLPYWERALGQHCGSFSRTDIKLTSAPHPTGSPSESSAR
jgi:hypothetical protein